MEIIQRVYGHRGLYRIALKPLMIQIFERLQKEQQIETTNKNSDEISDKTLSKP